MNTRDALVHALEGFAGAACCEDRAVAAEGLADAIIAARSETPVVEAPKWLDRDSCRLRGEDDSGDPFEVAVDDGDVILTASEAGRSRAHARLTRPMAAHLGRVLTEWARTGELKP